MAIRVLVKYPFPCSALDHVVLRAPIAEERDSRPGVPFIPLLGIGLLLCLVLSQISCASLLGFPTYYDATTYKNLTDLKAESLFLYDTFATELPDETKVAAVLGKNWSSISTNWPMGPSPKTSSRAMSRILKI